MILYTLPYCSRCNMVKRILEREGIPYEEQELTAELAERLDVREAPALVHNGKLVRGYAPAGALRKLYESGGG